MPVNAAAVRCEHDKALFDRLLKSPDVVRANEAIERRAGEGRMGVRRRLLATSVRLSAGMAEDVHRIAAECIAKLELDIPVELYVFPSPQFNAVCFKPESGRLFVMFSSSLLERFDGSELKFVIGHELGHYVYRHHDIPIGYILRGPVKPDSALALELFAWSRYAEISADRAGAHCAGDLASVARALFRLASGLGGETIRFSLDDFLTQLDEMQIDNGEPGLDAPQEDWFLTHPFSPLRVKALQLFHQSELAVEGGTPKADLEVAVQSIMSLMEPSYLQGRTEVAEAMRRALFAGALTVAAANGEISDDEIAMFEKFFGQGSYTGSLDVARLTDELPARLAQVRDKATVPQRMQLLRDLCVIAKAEGMVSEGERAVLDRVADGLGVSRRFICQTVDADLDLD